MGATTTTQWIRMSYMIHLFENGELTFSCDVASDIIPRVGDRLTLPLAVHGSESLPDRITVRDVHFEIGAPDTLNSEDATLAQITVACSADGAAPTL